MKDNTPSGDKPQSAENNLIQTPNFTMIPNVVMDYWIDKLSHAQFKLLIYLCRKTFGWHKTKDKISLSQLVQGTGLSKRCIQESLIILIQHKLVIKHSHIDSRGDNSTNEYELHVHIVHGGRALSSQGGRAMVAPTKESYLNKKESTLKSTKEKARTDLISFGDFVKMSLKDRTKLEEAHGKEVIQDYIDKINDHLLSTGKKPYPNYAATIRVWIRKDKERKLERSHQLNKLNDSRASKQRSESPNVQTNISLYLEVLKDVPDSGKLVKRWGNKFIATVDNKLDIYFDVSPVEFRLALLKMMEVEDGV